MSSEGQTPNKPRAAVTTEMLDAWANNPAGPVALHLRQKLVPVEGEGGVIFPPTYADIGYNIDVLADGSHVALIDSVGSQANRLEPIFKILTDVEGNHLVPQIEIVLQHTEGENPHTEKRSILDLAHRSADAVVQSAPTISTEVSKAFQALRRTGNAGPLCALAPTSLVFGAWDSRGGTGEKLPRLVRSVVRAWDVEPLHSAAQFNSIWKALDQDQRAELEKESKKQKTKLSEKGLADAPAVFRRAERIPQYRDGAPNPEARVLGGVLVNGRIERNVTVNLIALRGLRGENPEETKAIQKYLLGLSLLAATEEIDLYLREGCHLRYADEDEWNQVPRRGDPTPVDLASSDAKRTIYDYACKAAEHFRPSWPERLEHDFDLTAAKKLLGMKDDDNPGEA
jgi:CRISPR-associated protein Csb1